MLKKITGAEEIAQLLPKRKPEAHKGDFGRVLVFAGSRRYPGAAYLCAEAAVRCGSGLVTLASDYEVLDILSMKLNEAMVIHKSAAEVQGLIETADAIAVGCGMGRRSDTLSTLEQVLNSVKETPVVIDADGLNMLCGKLELIKGRANVLLTPHEGEFARLIGSDSAFISRRREALAENFVRKYGVNLLLKGKHTIVASPDEFRINPSGSSKMASGGMGDALTGMIASFAGQGMDVYTAGYFAAFVHGYCGDEKGKTMYSVTAGEVIRELPYALQRLAEKNKKNFI